MDQNDENDFAAAVRLAFHKRHKALSRRGATVECTPVKEIVDGHESDVGRTDVGFDAPDNEVLLVAPDEPARQIPKASKREVADRIWDEVIRIRNSRRSQAPVATPPTAD